MFHRAEPDEAGFGVMSFTPGLIRSSQPLMPCGLPFGTTITTTESDTMPFVGPSFQVVSTSPAFTRRVTSPSNEKLHVVGLQTVRYRSALIAGSTVRLLPDHTLTLRASPRTSSGSRCWPPSARRSRPDEGSLCPRRPTRVAPLPYTT